MRGSGQRIRYAIQIEPSRVTPGGGVLLQLGGQSGSH